MGKQKSRAHRTSSGKRSGIRKARAEKKLAKFAAKRENGTAYVYKPNPYKEGTNEYEREAATRANKQRKPLTIQRLTSIFAKLDNEIEKEKMANKDKFSNKSSKKTDK